MKEIKLTRGYHAQVSDEDYERIYAMNWFASIGVQVRAARMSLRRMIYMHHEVLQIMPWELNGQEVDHIDGNPLNNQRENLRLVTHVENMRNTSRHKERVGVCYNKRVKRWMAYLDNPGKKRRYLGYAATREEALAKVEAAR